MAPSVPTIQAGAMNAAVPPPPPSTDQDPTPPSAGGPRVSHDQMRDLSRLRRSSTDKKIAGVAGGIARHLDVDPLVVRILLVVLAFFGGAGLIIYGACWILVPDDFDNVPIRLDDRTRTLALIVIGALAAVSVVGDSIGGWDFPWPLAVLGVIAVIVLASNSNKQPHPGPPPGTPGMPGAPQQPAFGGPAWTPPAYAGQWTNTRRRGPIHFGHAMLLATLAVGVLVTLALAGVDITPSAYPAAVLASCGLMLLVSAFHGRGGGLIFVGLIAAAATAATSIVPPTGADLFAGQIERNPGIAADLDNGYSLGAGEIRIDLSKISDLDELDGRTLDLEARVGHILVVVPDRGLDVKVDATIRGAGESVLFNSSQDGSSDATHDGGADKPEFTIDAELIFGQIEVQTAGSQR